MIKTTSPEIGQELEKALNGDGYKFNPHFRFGYDNKKPHTSKEFLYDLKTRNRAYLTVYRELPPVYTMGELLAMLPMTIHKEGQYFEFTIIHLNPGFWIHYQSGNGTDYDSDDHYDTTMINALAKLVMWCIENGHKLNLPSK